jgi:hypothetical protein
MHIFLFQVLKPLQDRFKNIICQENFNRIFHEENVKMEIIDILESFIGKSMLFCMSCCQLVMCLHICNLLFLEGNLILLCVTLSQNLCMWKLDIEMDH